ncbi:MAG TPA: Uma2 family endonuclease [Methylomirabilota bacterium]|jgi:Uma2 family endonuclease|nr:Uma2 family endonuclease [Methylomirabilota bacterium]
MATRIVLTYADYAAIPNDGRRYELHEGELSVTPAPGTRHQQVVGNLYLALRHHVDAHRVGQVFVSPIDCILSDTTIVQPDIVYVDNTRLTAVSARGIEGPPTLVVEILSPGTEAVDRKVKLQIYARHRVPHYWIVDPESRTIEAHALTEGVYAVTARIEGAPAAALPPFANLALDPASIWPEP